MRRRIYGVGEFVSKKKIGNGAPRRAPTGDSADAFRSETGGGRRSRSFLRTSTSKVITGTKEEKAVGTRKGESESLRLRRYSSFPRSDVIGMGT